MANKINLDGLATMAAEVIRQIDYPNNEVGNALRLINLTKEIASLVSTTITAVKDQEDRLLSLERDEENRRERRAGADW